MKKTFLILVLPMLLAASQCSQKTLAEKVAETCLGYAGLTDFVVNARLLGKISDETWSELRPVGVTVGEICSDQSKIQTEEGLVLLEGYIDRLIAEQNKVLANGQ